MDDGWTLPRPRHSSAGSLPPYSSVVTSQPTSTRGEVIQMQSFSDLSSARDGSRTIPPAPPTLSSAGDDSRMSAPAPPRASTKVTSSGQGLRVTSSVTDYALPLPTLAMRSEKPGVSQCLLPLSWPWPGRAASEGPGVSLCQVI